MRGSTKTIGLLFFAVFIFALLLIGCEAANEGGSPERPKSVPHSAIWVGGADGGVFVAIRREETDPQGLYRASVYYESGELWYSGRLEMKPKGELLSLQDATEFLGWDGEVLYCADGRKLVAIDTD